MIRVLVVEDSPTSRLLLVRILNADPQIEVVGEAADGVEGVRLTHRLRPNLVTMDVDMPRMDGLEATQEIMSTVPTPIVIVTSNPQAKEVETSLAMLRMGALDVLLKPPGPEMMSLRNGTPASRSRATSPVMSSTTRWMRFQPPGPGLAPSGMGRPAELAGPLSSSRRLPRVTSAKAGTALVSNSKPRCSV